MTVSLLLLASVVATISAVFAMLAFHRLGRFASGPAHEQLQALLRGEVDRILRFGDEQSRGLREELGGTIRGFQDSTLKAFRELGDALATRINEFGNRMDAGVKAIDDRAVAIGHKLDHDIAHMGEDAGRVRDALRQVIESKLDDAALKHASTAMESRQEMIANFKSLGGTVTETIGQLGAQQKERLDNVTVALGNLTETQERAHEGLKNSVEQRLDAIRNENAAKKCAEPSTKSCNRHLKRGSANRLIGSSNSLSGCTKASAKCSRWPPASAI